LLPEPLFVCFKLSFLCLGEDLPSEFPVPSLLFARVERVFMLELPWW